MRLFREQDVPEIEPLELRQLLRQGPRPVLIDVREPDEHELVKLDGSHLFPLMQVEQRFNEIRTLIDPDRTTVIYCRSGGRSALVVRYLLSRGLPSVNLRGGINAYATEADPQLRPY